MNDDASLVVSVAKYLPMQEMQEMQFQSLGQEDPLEEEMATHHLDMTEHMCVVLMN